MADKPAEPGPPDNFTVHYFSNGTEFDIWGGRWCNRCERDFELCSHIDSMYLGRPDKALTGGRLGAWVCATFKEKT